MLRPGVPVCPCACTRLALQCTIRTHARAHARACVRAHTYTLHTIHRMCGMLAASLVTHADDKWIEQLKALYRARITPGAVVLDLMGSHIRQAPT